MNIQFNPNASFLPLTGRFTWKVKREIKRRKKRLEHVQGLFGTKNKNIHKNRSFSYEPAEAILAQEGAEAITLFFCLGPDELVVYGPAANRGEMEKAYQYTSATHRQKPRWHQGWQKFWSVMGKVAIIATPIGAAIAGILLYLALTRQ